MKIAKEIHVAPCIINIITPLIEWNRNLKKIFPGRNPKVYKKFVLEDFPESVKRSILGKLVQKQKVFQAQIGENTILCRVTKTKPKGLVQISQESKIKFDPRTDIELLFDLRLFAEETKNFIDKHVGDHGYFKVIKDKSNKQMLDENLPSFEDFSGLDLSASDFGATAWRMFGLDEDENVFLVIRGDFSHDPWHGDDHEKIREKFGNNSLFLFTDRRVVIVDGKIGRKVFLSILFCSIYATHEEEKV